MKLLTLCFLQQENQILLGMKKRGFGEGKWNAFGGKLKENESIEEAMKREVFEECGVKILSFKKVGIVWETHPTWSDTLEIHIFTSHEFSGIPHESEEMLPKWFINLPYDSMWEGDCLWIPKMLSGEKLNLFIELDNNNKVKTYVDKTRFVE